MSNLAFLALGSNLQPEDNLLTCVALLANYGRIRAVSSVWQTTPLGYREQPDFLNAAILLETEYTALELRSVVIPQIESRLGRTRTANKDGPRTIDIDLILFNQEVFQMGRRRVPDPELFERAFVALPLAELDPDFVHPESGQTLQQIAGQFQGDPHTMRLRSDIDLASAAAPAAGSGRG